MMVVGCGLEVGKLDLLERMGSKGGRPEMILRVNSVGFVMDAIGRSRGEA